MSAREPKPHPGRTPVALQLWSIREDVKRDFAATVGEVAAMGYHGVELAGYGNLDSRGAKAALDAAGLKVAGMHVPFSALSADTDTVIADALLLGCRHVVCPWWPPALLISASVCERLGERLAEIGRTLRAHGIQLGYHNHDSEFRIFNGRPAFDWILGAAAPRDLFAEVDVYWVQKAGYSPAKFLRDQGARVVLVHLKDSRELGTGPVDFDAVFAATDSTGSVEWFIVEQEEYSHSPMESVRLCLEKMKSWGRA